MLDFWGVTKFVFVVKHDYLEHIETWYSREGKPGNATSIGIYEILLGSQDVSQHRRDDSRWFLITDTSCLDCINIKAWNQQVQDMWYTPPKLAPGAQKLVC